AILKRRGYRWEITKARIQPNGQRNSIRVTASNRVMKLFAVVVLAIPLTAQRNFETPEAAAQALIDAAGNNNAPTLQAIFGAGAKTVLTSGAPDQEKAARDEIASIAKNRH